MSVDIAVPELAVTTGQRIFVLLNLFNILIHDIYRKIDKIALERKNLKFLEFFGINFGSFCGPWGQLKKSRNLHKYKSHKAKILWIEFYW